MQDLHKFQEEERAAQGPDASDKVFSFFSKKKWEMSASKKLFSFFKRVGDMCKYLNIDFFPT